MSTAPPIATWPAAPLHGRVVLVAVDGDGRARGWAGLIPSGRERRLRAALVRDGLRPAEGYTLARYNDPSTPGFRRRNEVMIELPGYELPQ